CRRLLRSPAALRLSPDSPIKALDPAGIASYCLLLLIDRKLRIYFWGLSEKTLDGDILYYRLPLFEHANAAANAFRHTALMRFPGRRLTRFSATSKLFFAASQDGR
ncbi:MAG TPA: hypothetical protein VIF81_10380, partial [Pyrinomonadaceae bacterium]